MDKRADVTVDVAIVGGGIAGAALATVLARDGYEVLLLERQTSYRDKVRGEILGCWGVAEMLALDLEKPLLDAGGHYVTPRRDVRRGDRPRTAEANAAPLDRCSRASPAAWTSGTRRRARRWPAPPPRPGRPWCAASATSRSSPASRRRCATSSTTWSRPCPPGSWSAPTGGRRASAGSSGSTCTRPRPRTMAGGMLVDGLDGVARRPDVAGHRRRPLLPRLPPGTRPRPPLPAARHRPARPVRRAGPRGDVPRRVPAPAACPTPGSSGRPARPGRARSTR